MRARRPHLAGHAQDHDVALEPGEISDQFGRRFAQQLCDVLLRLSTEGLEVLAHGAWRPRHG